MTFSPDSHDQAGGGDAAARHAGSKDEADLHAAFERRAKRRGRRNQPITFEEIEKTEDSQATTPALPPCPTCGHNEEVTKIGFPSTNSEDYHCNSCGFFFDPDLPLVGIRARLRRGVERFPHFYVEPGYEGVVVEATDSLISLRMDNEIPSAGEWDNEVCWTAENAADQRLSSVASIFFEDAEIIGAETVKVRGRNITPAALNDVSAVEDWFRALLAAGVNFHPDESFAEIVSMKTGDRCFDPQDAERLDRLMDQAHELCDASEVALRVLAASGRLG